METEVEKEHPVYKVLRERKMSLRDMALEIETPKDSLWQYLNYKQNPGLLPALKMWYFCECKFELFELLRDVDQENEIIDIMRYYGQG